MWLDSESLLKKLLEVLVLYILPLLNNVTILMDTFDIKKLIDKRIFHPNSHLGMLTTIDWIIFLIIK